MNCPYQGAALVVAAEDRVPPRSANPNSIRINGKVVKAKAFTEKRR